MIAGDMKPASSSIAEWSTRNIAGLPIEEARTNLIPPHFTPPQQLGYLRHCGQVLLIAAKIGPKHAALFAIDAVRQREALTAILRAWKEPVFRRHLQARPEIWGMIRSSFMSARWSASERIERVIDHCRAASALGPLFEFPFDHYVELPALSQVGPGYRVTLDQPRWMLKVGQLALSIWEGSQRIYSITFSLTSEGVVYVGGLQGEKYDSGIERYRAFKRAANGMRPRDLTVELLRMLCRAIDAREILAVSDAIHAQRAPVRILPPADDFFAGYDEAWQERGGVCGDDGFFRLPLERQLRAAEDIPTRKRALYRRRDAMLDSIGSDLKVAVARGLVPGQLRRY